MTRMKYLARTLAPLTLLAALPQPAAAHLVSTRFGELYSGLLHPLTSLVHLVPWLALGLWLGLQPAQRGRWMLLLFPVAVIAGVSLALAAADATAPGLLPVASFIILGGACALAARVPLAALALVVVLVGIVHGYANLASGVVGYDFVLYATGLGLAAYLAVTLPAAGVHALVAARPWGTVAVRAAGSWVAAAGLMYAGFLMLGPSAS